MDRRRNRPLRHSISPFSLLRGRTPLRKHHVQWLARPGDASCVKYLMYPHSLWKSGANQPYGCRLSLALQRSVHDITVPGRCMHALSGANFSLSPKKTGQGLLKTGRGTEKGFFIARCFCSFCQRLCICVFSQLFHTQLLTVSHLRIYTHLW